MPNETNDPAPNAGAAYDALNMSFRMMDEWMRQTQHLTEQIWMPWIRPFVGTASPFIPPEQWARAYGDIAMVWMSMAQAWTRSFAQMMNPSGQSGPGGASATPTASGSDQQSGTAS